MSEIKVNKISPKQTCTQLTLGDSGDTIIIPAGATITNSGTATGFGATYNGAINWDTTAKTTGFTAVSGTGYFCDTTSAAFTATLPASPTAGSVVAFKDYAKTWNTNNLTIERNSSNIEGQANNSIQSIQGQSITLIYVNSTKGWVIVDSAQYSDLSQASFVAATGGTILTCGDYKTHVFTGPGTFTVSSAGNAQGSNSVEYLVVAGGGSGGTGGSTAFSAGGGGAGGYRQNYPSPATAGLPVTATSYPITVGAGGTGGSLETSNSGNNSIFSTITSTGGGAGAYSSVAGTNGGSGGGARNPAGGSGFGSGNTPPVSPPQGNPGSNGDSTGPGVKGGAGGGASAAGTAATPTLSGVGGAGSPIATAFFGPTSPSYGTPGPAPGRYFAGGGGGKVECGVPGASAGGGGAGGGGAGSTGTSPGTAGTTNTGGGGGGVASGGSGIVVIRYKFQ